MKQLAEGIHQWSVFSDAKGYDFNGLYLDLGAARVLVDPPPMSPEVIARIDELGAPSWIYLTNKDHTRDAVRARERFRAKVAMHDLDKPAVDLTVDEVFDDGDTLAGALQVVGIPASKSPGETALYWPARKALIIGDAIIGNPPGQLSMLPDGKFSDPALARKELAVLRDLDVDMLLLGDGQSIPQGAGDTLRAFIDAAAGS
jgi:glyoxylase-like metal-dependent hydrolase (beta-lactamase superfamily II)